MKRERIKNPSVLGPFQRLSGASSNHVNVFSAVVHTTVNPVSVTLVIHGPCSMDGFWAPDGRLMKIATRQSRTDVVSFIISNIYIA